MEQCECITLNGKRCRRRAKEGEIYCGMHDGTSKHFKKCEHKISKKRKAKSSMRSQAKNSRGNKAPTSRAKSPEKVPKSKAQSQEKTPKSRAKSPAKVPKSKAKFEEPVPETFKRHSCKSKNIEGKKIWRCQVDKNGKYSNLEECINAKCEWSPVDDKHEPTQRDCFDEFCLPGDKWKKCFKRNSLIYHPDKNENQPENVKNKHAEMFRKLNNCNLKFQ